MRSMSSMTKMNDLTKITVKLSDELWSDLEEARVRLRRTRTSLVVEALEIVMPRFLMTKVRPTRKPKS